MTTQPDEGRRSASGGQDGDFGRRPTFDAAYVYQLLQQACQALEEADEFAAAAHAAQAMALVQERFHVGADHRIEP